MDFPLSTDILEGLKLASDTTYISDDCFADFLDRVCESIYDESKKSVVGGKTKQTAPSRLSSTACERACISRLAFAGVLSLPGIITKGGSPNLLLFRNTIACSTKSKKA